MGQYHYVVNLDKKEFLHAHELGSGIKLWEQLANHPGTQAGLVLLLAASNGRGGGDFYRASDDVVGRWAGDRIAIVGDYAEAGDLAPEHQAETIYERCQEGDNGEKAEFTDISAMVREAICAELNLRYVQNERYGIGKWEDISK